MPQTDAAELFHFTWSVPDRGYVWRNDMKADIPLGTGERPPFLMVHPESKTETRYDPLPDDEDGSEDTPLFQQFADLDLSQETIKAFADRWGWLGASTRLAPSKSRKKIVTVEKGESLEIWLREIQDVRRAVTLWKWSKRKDSAVQVTWESKECVRVRISRYASKPDNGQKDPDEVLLHQRFLPDLFDKFRHNNPVLPAQAALALLINKKLNGLASPRLLLNRHGTIQGFVRPRNLLAAIWVQLYQAIQGQRRIVACKYCHQLMDVTGHRVSKTAHSRCGHNAKMNRYRKKRAAIARTKK
ncbi:MAG: hypothetical protein NW202_13090 [Nitrospira sp.]|nr:hypothetical protein [Nitrospira sp.]